MYIFTTFTFFLLWLENLQRHIIHYKRQNIFSILFEYVKSDYKLKSFLVNGIDKQNFCRLFKSFSLTYTILSKGLFEALKEHSKASCNMCVSEETLLNGVFEGNCKYLCPLHDNGIEC